MKLLLLTTTFNSQTQAIYTKLKDLNHTVSVCFAINEKQMLQEIETFKPKLILCPFLKSYLPASVYENYPTYIFHPAPRGDRGAYSLEYALQEPSKKWGVVVLRANSEYDGGDIYAEASFKVRQTYKASLYRQEVVSASLELLDELFENIENNRATPQILNPIHEPFTQAKRAIDWQRDSTFFNRKS